MTTQADILSVDHLSKKVVAIIQARMGASRLPGKVLADIGGQPMLVRVIERTRRAKSLAEVIVATTQEPADDVIAGLCSERGYPCFRGSHQDVLDRYYQAASEFSAEIVVRITADCPVIDPIVIDQTVAAFLGHISPLIINGQATPITPEASRDDPPWDFATNRLPPPWRRTFPIGLDTEVCTLTALEKAWFEARHPHHREHVMPYLYETPGRFRTLLVDHEPDYGYLRWTVDTHPDLNLVREIYARFDGRDDFSWMEILHLFEREPWLANINRDVPHKDFRMVDKRKE